MCDNPTVTFQIDRDPSAQPNGYVNLLFNQTDYHHDVTWSTPVSAPSGAQLELDFNGDSVTGGGGSPQKVTVNAGLVDASKSFLDNVNPPATNLVAGTDGLLTDTWSPSVAASIEVPPTISGVAIGTNHSITVVVKDA